jgi:hypothetical protein
MCKFYAVRAKARLDRRDLIEDFLFRHIPVRAGVGARYNVDMERDGRGAGALRRLCRNNLSSSPPGSSKVMSQWWSARAGEEAARARLAKRRAKKVGRCMADVRLQKMLPGYTMRQLRESGSL